MARLSFLIFFLFLTLSLPNGFKRITCGFKLSKMALKESHRDEWEVPCELSRQEINAILSQPYFYLDRGAQCYVFSSLDDHYVVKIFRYDQSSFFSKKTEIEAKEKMEKMFTACVLAFTKAKEETGVLFLHLNETDQKLPTLHAKGPIHQSISLPLDHCRFVVQKKMKPFRESLLEAYRSSDDEKIKRQIDSFVSVIRTRASKGIRNTDPSVSRNFGYLGDKAFEIDFGNYSETTAAQDLEIARFTRKLRAWLIDNAPEWVAYLDSVSHG